MFARIILLAAGGACALTLGHFLYFYAWIGDRQFTSWLGPILYYVFPGIAALLLFASLRLRPAYRLILAAVCGATVASAYGLEVVLKIAEVPASMASVMNAPAAERKTIAAKLTRQFGVDVDTRERHEVIADLRNRDIHAVPQLILPAHERGDGSEPLPTIDGAEFTPLAGISNTETVVCNQNGQYFRYKSDEHGFHNPPGIWQSSPIDIVAVGNSLTMGWCVPSDKNFVALVRRQYPATLNLGMTGEGPLHLLGVLNEYAPRLKPKLVLWFYSAINSLPELRNEKQSPILMRYLNDDFSQGLFGRQSDIDHAVTDLIERQTVLERSRQSKSTNNGSFTDKLRDSIKLGALRRQLGVVDGETRIRRSLSEMELELESDLNLMRDILSQARAKVSTWGGNLYFVYLPGLDQSAGDPHRGIAGTELMQIERDLILRLVKALSIPIVDLNPAFQTHRDPLSLFPFRGFGHYNEHGHGLVAEEVLGFLRGFPTSGRTENGN